MKKFLTLAICACLFLSTSAQYWQQEVNFKIDVSLNDKQHTLKGFEEIEYINHSPDQLNFIWFHIWPNAYKNESTAFAKQLSRDGEGRQRLKKFRDKGFIDSLDFTVDGEKAVVEKHPEHIDVIKLILPKPLASGGKVMIKTPFFVDLPEYISRSGHAGQSYMICQWFSKPAVYDRKGWHAFPYLDQGEFYSEFGKYDVTITVPSDYIVGATGELQTADELKQYREIGTRNRTAFAKKNLVKYNAPASPTKSLQYKGENILDFAWFADKDFVIRYDTMSLATGKTIDVFTYHHSNGNRNWINSTDFVKSGTRAYSSYLGEYAYPVVQAVEGPKNESSGGMEYPMITLITSPDASPEMLDAVITHEVGHNWFMCMIGTNERKHAWMDEGINTYYQFRYEAEKYRYSSVFGDHLPSEMKSKNAVEFQMHIYDALNKIPMHESIDIPSPDFSSKEAYGLVSYLKTAIWVYIMELQLGRDKVDQALKSYFTEWKFRHPYPEDLQAVFEKELGRSLKEYFDLLYKEGRI